MFVVFLYIFKTKKYLIIHVSLWECCLHSCCYTLSLLHTVLQMFLQVVMNDPSADTDQRAREMHYPVGDWYNPPLVCALSHSLYACRHLL